MKHLTLANIAAACGGEYVGDRALADREIQGAVTDSRQVQEGYLFIPVR
jgi:UDP-N-acetylmuramoyl-tripeptide--D-alanyl-D-alanine ligase